MAERKRLKIIWTTTAETQFFRILEYWTNRNKSNEYPLKLIQKITKRTKQIAQAPNSYRDTDFPHIRVSAMRQYSIFYKVENSNLVIIAFWDNRQDPKRLIQFIKGHS